VSSYNLHCPLGQADINYLPEHDCQTARYAGLAGLKNGQLLIAGMSTNVEMKGVLEMTSSRVPGTRPTLPGMGKAASC
jgi:hypothetical protein